MIEGAAVGVGTVLFALVIGVVVVLAARGGSATTSDGALLMRYGWGYRGLTVGLLLFGGLLLGLTVAIKLGAIREPEALVPMGLVTVGVLLVSGSLVVEGFRRQVTVGDEGLFARGWFGTTALVAWDEVKKVRFNKMLGCFEVVGVGETVRVPTMLGGRQEFIKACKRRLDKAVYGRVFKEHGNRVI